MSPYSIFRTFSNSISNSISSSTSFPYLRLVRKWRKILFPFSLLYGGIIWLRNKFFDWNWISSRSYDFPVICVGNLSVGGTGKSPMTEYLIRLLSRDYQVATLSRGYGRKSKGFLRLNGKESATQTGDEPLQFKNKFPHIEVVVDEDRQHGIAEIMKFSNPPQVILLDDAFQHRKVTPGFSILLTAYSNIYAKDWMLPAGDLREPRKSASRANIVVVTKCPPDLSLKQQDKIEKQLKLNRNQSLFFSFIAYDEEIFSLTHQMQLIEIPADFLLVTGIAKPEPLVNQLQQKDLRFTHQEFPDHYNFTDDDIRKINQAEFILTTEKDFMRLKNEIPSEKLYYLPIRNQFIKDAQKFDQQVKSWVEEQL